MGKGASVGPGLRVRGEVRVPDEASGAVDGPGSVVIVQERGLRDGEGRRRHGDRDEGSEAKELRKHPVDKERE